MELDEKVKQEQLKRFILAHEILMPILEIIRNLNLPQGCLCAGMIRNAVWNHLTTRVDNKKHDVDVVYFDPSATYEESLAIQKNLQQAFPDYQWEVKNQAFMHVHNQAMKLPPYSSVVDAISHFPERCTAIGAYLDELEKLHLIAPYGVSDIFAMKVRPTPLFQSNEHYLDIYLKRQQQKKWQLEWPELKIEK